MTATARRGTPALAILAGGISRHGRGCDCSYCYETFDHPRYVPLLASVPIPPSPEHADVTSIAEAVERHLAADVAAKAVKARSAFGTDWLSSRCTSCGAEFDRYFRDGGICRHCRTTGGTP